MATISNGHLAHWDSIRSLFQAADLMGVPDLGVHAHFHVQLDGRAHTSGDAMLVSGHLLEGWSLHAGPLSEGRQKVVVRLRPSDYYAIAKHASTIRILHSTIDEAGSPPIIEANVGASVVAAAFHTRQDEVVMTAELFSGAFSGWTQAVTVMHYLSVPVRVRWLLDQDPTVWRSTQMVHEGPLYKVENTRQLQRALEGSMDVFALATFQHKWWHKLLAIPDLELLLASPPCPAWSSASYGPGLESEDGRLFLHLFALLEVFQIPGVLVEQVSGFKAHPHFDCLRAVWESIGYRMIWEYHFDLVDCAPGSRPRFLMLLVRSDKVPLRPIPKLPPVLPRRPTLASFQCLVQLPLELLQPCQLDEATLAQYLNPALLPATARGQGGPLDVQLYRVRAPNQRFGCVMAQYHSQHELPHSALCSKGLLGHLLQSSQGVRFLSGLEASFLHGLVRPYVLHPDDKVQMRHIGNSLSVFQSSFALAHGLQAAQSLCSVPEPTLVLRTCLSKRTHAGNFRIEPCAYGWVVFQEHQLSEVQMKWPDFGGLSGYKVVDGIEFRGLKLTDEVTEFVVALAPGLTVPAVLEAFGLEAPVDVLQRLPAISPVSLSQSPPAMPSLFVSQLGNLDPATALLPTDVSQTPSLMWVKANGIRFVMPVQGPGLFHLLEAVHMQCAAQQPHMAGHHVWLDPLGSEVRFFQHFRAGCSLHLFAPFDGLAVPSIDPADLGLLAVRSCVGPLHIQVPSEAQHRTQSLWLPELYDPIGWHPVQWEQSGLLNVLWRPLNDGPRLSENSLLPRCALFLFKGCLQYLYDKGERGYDRVLILVQLAGRFLWSGALPSSFTLQDIQDLWNACHEVTRVPRLARVYSGPWQVPPEWTLAQAAAQSRKHVSFTRQGHLRVTFMPELRGGGQKDLQFAAAQTAVAQLLLSRGQTLADATRVTDRVMAVGGLGRVNRILQLADATHQWQELTSLCERHAIALPEVVSRPNKAQMAVRKKANRRALRQQLLLAKDFRLQDDFFRLADGQPAAVLRDLFPGCTGVDLVDPSAALPLLQAFANSGADELALVILGTECPAPSTCQGPLTCPALSADASPLFLKCCCIAGRKEDWGKVS